MGKMTNSNPNADVLPSAATCHKPMLGAGALSGENLSAEQKLKLSVPTNFPQSDKQTISANDLLKLIENAVPTSERMDFTVPFAKYQNVVNALEVCENYIKNLQQT
jgi:hypothetical protein